MGCTRRWTNTAWQTCSANRGSVKQMLYWKGDIISPTDGAQSTLHCLLADDVQSGKFYSQTGVYIDDEKKKGGWPLDLGNPNATEEKAAKLWKVSEDLVAA